MSGDRDNDKSDAPLERNTIAGLATISGSCTSIGERQKKRPVIGLVASSKFNFEVREWSTDRSVGREFCPTQRLYLGPVERSCDHHSYPKIKK